MLKQNKLLQNSQRENKLKQQQTTAPQKTLPGFYLFFRLWLSAVEYHACWLHLVAVLDIQGQWFIALVFPSMAVVQDEDVDAHQQHPGGENEPGPS